jgi:hypothetical protein
MLRSAISDILQMDNNKKTARGIIDNRVLRKLIS